MVIFSRNFLFTTSALTALLGHPVQKYFLVFCFNKKNLITDPS